ncbi:MAG: RNA 2',3'-cyclic phosphodiesterase [Bacteroidota bacterium]
MSDQLLRSFVGIFPPAELIDRLVLIQSKLKPFAPHAKWEKEKKFHITVEFLGDKTELWLKQLNNDIRNSLALPPFNIELTHCGAFPSDRSPKVFWIGSNPEKNSQLENLAEMIRKITKLHGHTPDAKPFHPHITIGRAKGKISSNLIQNIETVTFHPIEFTCSEIRIMRSRLASTGSTYTTLFTIPLK